MNITGELCREEGDLRRGRWFKCSDGFGGSQSVQIVMHRRRSSLYRWLLGTQSVRDSIQIGIVMVVYFCKIGGRSGYIVDIIEVTETVFSITAEIQMGEIRVGHFWG